MLINRAALAASLGGKPSADAIAAQVHEIEQVVASAAGLNRERGDAVKISVVDFVDFKPRPQARPRGLSSVYILARQTGSILNAGFIVAVAAMMLWFGVRPAVKMAFAPPRLVAAGDARGASGGLTLALAAPDAPVSPAKASSSRPT